MSSLTWGVAPGYNNGAPLALGLLECWPTRRPRPAIRKSKSGSGASRRGRWNVGPRGDPTGDTPVEKRQQSKSSIPSETGLPATSSRRLSGGADPPTDERQRMNANG
ncbi:MAG: hypothetical protein ACFCU3_11325 [Verrucomicrobiales bacterium]